MNFFNRALIGLAAIVLLVVGFVISIGWFIAPQDELRKADAIVVVSGGDTVKRTDQGVRLWQDGWAPRLVFAGAAADQGTSNAAVMRLQAVTEGVPLGATFVEERSTTTRENAEFVKPILESQNAKSVILVSSPYHTRRVKLNFEKVYSSEYDFLVHPALDSRWARKSWWRESDTVGLTWDELRKTIYIALGGERSKDNTSR